MALARENRNAWGTCEIRYLEVHESVRGIGQILPTTPTHPQTMVGIGLKRANTT